MYGYNTCDINTSTDWELKGTTAADTEVPGKRNTNYRNKQLKIQNDTNMAVRKKKRQHIYYT